MIRYKNSSSSDWNVLVPTIFPDQSSQVWKLKESAKYIRWNFESEAELFHVLQLIALQEIVVSLEIPYFPYARQDKEISNDTTFARSVFIDLIKNKSLDFITYDVHSPIPNIGVRTTVNKRPDHFLEAIKDFKPDGIFFPDEGAMKRYQKVFLDSNQWNTIPKLYGQKVRNQQTGEITSYEIFTHKDFLNGERILICDDLCDFGNTFINAAKELNKLQVGTIGLAVSHGIFGGGLTPLIDAGITSFYTTDSFIKNGIKKLNNREYSIKIYQA